MEGLEQRRVGEKNKTRLRTLVPVRNREEGALGDTSGHCSEDLSYSPLKGPMRAWDIYGIPYCLNRGHNHLPTQES